MQVVGAAHVGPLRRPGTLLGPRGVGGYTTHRDSSWIRRSSTRPGTKCVDARRMSMGDAPSAPTASTDTSTWAAPAPAPERVFSQGGGNGPCAPFTGRITSSVTTLPATLMTTCTEDTTPPMASLWM